MPVADRPDPPTIHDYEPSEWRVYRSLVDFSIGLRHRDAFQDAVRTLRERWEIDPLGEWLQPEAITLQMRSPVLWEVWNGLFRGPYPPAAEDDDQARAEFEHDVGMLLRRFVPLDRFPPSKAKTGPLLAPDALARFHPLACFHAVCVLYAVLSLPADIGIASPPYRVLDDRAAGDLVYVPADATRSDAHDQVDELFDRLEYREGESDSDPVGRRTLGDLKASYEAWRLRKNGLRLREVADELVSLGIDEKRRPDSTISSRIQTAQERWGLPTATYEEDEQT